MNVVSELADRFWAFQCDEMPLLAIMAGLPTDAEQIMREAPEDHERRAAWAEQALAELDAVDPASLGHDDAATYQLLRRELDLLVRHVQERAHLRPSLYPLSTEFSLGYWASLTVIANRQEAQLYLARLRKVPDVLNGLMRALRQGVSEGIGYPKVLVETTTGHVRAQFSMPVEESPFLGPLKRSAQRSDVMAAFLDEGRSIVTDLIYPVYEAYASFIADELGAVARDTVGCDAAPDGGGFYRLLVAQHTTLDRTPDEIHAIGLAEVQRLNADLEKVAADAGFPGDLDGFRAHLKEDEGQFATSAKELLEQIQIMSKEIDAEIPLFFGRLPRITYAVKSIPEAVADKMPVAYAQPNPADGTGPGIHWITSKPEKCPRYMHLPLALHEAWPGHLMQLALVQELDHLPAFRRYGALRYTACIEGWALYCERLGEEMGFYDTPEKQYGRIEMELWRAVRLVVDTGLHAKGWSRDQAVTFAKRYLAMPDTTIQSEINRYIGLPGQALSYQTGNLKICELRARAEAALGEGFDLRDFHDALLSCGPVTLPVLENVIDRWIDARGQGAGDNKAVKAA